MKVAISLVKKTRTQKERRDYAAFQKMIIGLDWKCMNKDCPCHNFRYLPVLQAHHIRFKSHIVDDSKENGIAFCPISHNRAHNGYRNEKGKWISGLEFVIGVLESWLFTPEWRWDKVYEELKNLRDLKAVGKDNKK